MSAAPDPRARLDALLKDSLPVFEEIADCCETAARSIRGVMLLMSAYVDAEALTPHVQTAMAAFHTLQALGPRVDAIVRKHNG